MPFTWAEYLNLAADLAGLHHEQYSEEARYRTAVSRAYYAAFCHARDYAARHLGFVPTGKPEDHRKLREYLQNKGGKWISVARYLNDLRQSRNACDYLQSVNNVVRQASLAIDQARRVFKACV